MTYEEKRYQQDQKTFPQIIKGGAQLLREGIWAIKRGQTS
jgi:hypothetical protein